MISIVKYYTVRIMPVLLEKKTMFFLLQFSVKHSSEFQLLSQKYNL